MKRRDILRGGVIAGLTMLSGCISPISAKSAFTYTPPSPVVGEKVVFDASESNARSYDWFFDKPPGVLVDAQGMQVAHAFEESGAHTVTLRTTAPFGIIPGVNLDRTTKTVYVENSDTTSTDSENSISISTGRISLHLRGLTTRVTTDETAVIQFSAVNLDPEADLSIRLVLKVPSGMDVHGTSLAKSGAGQYVATFDIQRGETAGTSIRLAATRTGRFEVEGIANFSFQDGDEQIRQGSIPIIVTDN